MDESTNGRHGREIRDAQAGAGVSRDGCEDAPRTINSQGIGDGGGPGDAQGGSPGTCHDMAPGNPCVFVCDACWHVTHQALGDEKPKACPKCGRRVEA